jgi:antitoxin component of MazEF toxin-antitoxin module
MVRTLQKHGNSHALVIDRTLMDALGIDPETPLQITVVGGSLVVAPADVGLGREAVDTFLRRVRPRYARMLKRLAQ